MFLIISLGMHFTNLYSEPEILESFLIKCLICSSQVSVSLIIIPRNFIASTCSSSKLSLKRERRVDFDLFDLKHIYFDFLRFMWR